MSVIDEYLKDIAPPERQALSHIRDIVLGIVPGAEETISYGLPTLKHEGRPLIHFAAFKDHLSVFPTADPALLKIDQLKEFQTSKGTLQFTLEKPIPDVLIEEIVRARLRSIAGDNEL